MRNLENARQAAFNWAAKNHPEELRVGVDAFLQGLERDAENAQAAIAFALLTTDGDGPTLTERWAASLRAPPRAFRTAIDAWSKGRFGVFLVDEVLTGGASVVDPFEPETELYVSDPEERLDSGEWIFAFLVPDGDDHELDGSVMHIARHERHPAVRALIDVAGPTPDLAGRRRAARAMFRAIQEAPAIGRLVNADGHPLMPVVVDLDLPWESVEAVVSTWSDVIPDEDGFTVLGPPHARGRIFWARLDRESRQLFVNSEERWEAFQARWGAPVPTRHVEKTELPTGEGIDLVQEVLVDDEGNGLPWADELRPELGMSARDAGAAGRRPEVWALLPDDEDERAEVIEELGL